MQQVGMQQGGGEQPPPLAVRARGSIHQSSITKSTPHLAQPVKNAGQQHPGGATPIKEQSAFEHGLAPLPPDIFTLILFNGADCAIGVLPADYERPASFRLVGYSCLNALAGEDQSPIH